VQLKAKSVTKSTTESLQLWCDVANAYKNTAQNTAKDQHLKNNLRYENVKFTQITHRHNTITTRLLWCGLHTQFAC